MPEWVKRALTRRVERKGSPGKQQIITIRSSDKIVYRVKFTLGMTVCLSCLEVAHLVVLGRMEQRSIRSHNRPSGNSYRSLDWTTRLAIRVIVANDKKNGKKEGCKVCSELSAFPDLDADKVSSRGLLLPCRV
ncbi:hypothetical protein MUP01_02700 [Candidatus Bathyarchaeota archaeon]|nr:hypothetical protein [Candidatus Bathyarchaeota archaeon]